MVQINEHYLTLKPTYLFSEIARRVKTFAAAHPDARLIRLGIGDVTLPLAPTVVRAMHEAVDEMARAETFRGYGPETGYEFLTELIAAHDYGARGVRVATDEIFVSDGAKSDTGNIQEIFSATEISSRCTRSGMALLRFSSRPLNADRRSKSETSSSASCR